MRKQGGLTSSSKLAGFRANSLASNGFGLGLQVEKTLRAPCTWRSDEEDARGEVMRKMQASCMPCLQWAHEAKRRMTREAEASVLHSSSKVLADAICAPGLWCFLLLSLSQVLVRVKDPEEERGGGQWRRGAEG
jgi:hypothetical protein